MAVRLIRNTFLKRILPNQHGMALVEFAICLPFLFLMFAGAIDVTRMVLLHQKVDKVAFTIGDLVTQLEAENGICNYIRTLDDEVAADIIRPFPYKPQQYKLIVTSVLGTQAAWDPSGPVRDMIEWQYVSNGGPGGTASYVGNSPGGYQRVANLPASISGLPQNERIIVTEAWYFFEPILPMSFGTSYSTTAVDAHQIHKISFLRGRIVKGPVAKGKGPLASC